MYWKNSQKEQFVEGGRCLFAYKSVPIANKNRDKLLFIHKATVTSWKMNQTKVRKCKVGKKVKKGVINQETLFYYLSLKAKT